MRTGLTGAGALAALAMACVGVPVAMASATPMQAQHLAAVPLEIVGAHGAHRFRVEVARTPDEQETGLMFRRHIAPDGGMIFPTPEPRAVTFWMKNTLVPLDMVFIRADGTIARIAAMTTPLSTDLVPAGEPVTAVLELRGGRAGALGITAGDRVKWGG